jgi:predicted SAM-dependent methyltransferase
MNIEIGGGTLVQPGWVNLDPVHGDFARDLLRRAQDGRWPFPDGSANGVRASHVLEHIPAGTDRIFVFNEAHRVLAPGGTFEVIVPLFPTWQALADPTHVSYWVEESFAYFDGRLSAQADYGLRYWTTVEWEVRDGWEGRWVGSPR